MSKRVAMSTKTWYISYIKVYINCAHGCQEVEWAQIKSTDRENINIFFIHNKIFFSYWFFHVNTSVLIEYLCILLIVSSGSQRKQFQEFLQLTSLIQVPYNPLEKRKSLFLM